MLSATPRCSSTSAAVLRHYRHRLRVDMRALYRSVTAAAAMFLLPAAASRAQEAEVPQPPPQQPAACLTIAPVCALKPARKGELS